MSSRRGIDQSIEIDGKLDEPVWAQAAVLAGFSRYAPVDGAPADNADRSARVVFADGHALRHSRRGAGRRSVRATLADRDRIQSDDHVIIFLSTYNDGRQALVFGVNPLGVQLDGALAEGTRGIGRRLHRPHAAAAKRRTSAPTTSSSRRAASPPTATKSRSRIPFKSLRYQSQPISRTGAST